MTGAPVVVTGVGQRAGEYLAHHLVGRGYPVIGTYRTERDALALLEERGVALIHSDFYEPDAAGVLSAAIASRCTALRALIHNASDWLPENGDRPHVETFSRMMTVHAQVPYELNHSLATLLKACPAGHADIIHIGDYVSRHGSRKHIAYAASKAAQDNLTLSFAAQLAPKIKVNSIAPALLAFNERDDAPYRERAVSRNLLGREGGFESLASSVDYLLENTFVTGQIIALDGGRHLA